MRTGCSLFAVTKVVPLLLQNPKVFVGYDAEVI
jgi:hypothetical protein